MLSTLLPVALGWCVLGFAALGALWQRCRGFPGAVRGRMAALFAGEAAAAGAVAWLPIPWRPRSLI